jgi:hypothetical protein
MGVLTFMVSMLCVAQSNQYQPRELVIHPLDSIHPSITSFIRPQISQLLPTSLDSNPRATKSKGAHPARYLGRYVLGQVLPMVTLVLKELHNRPDSLTAQAMTRISNEQGILDGAHLASEFRLPCQVEAPCN